MDLAYRRYASPNELMGRMLRSGGLSGFVENLVLKHNEEAREKALWGFFLHKVQGKSYGEFKDEALGRAASGGIDADALVKDIRQGLRGFKMK